MLKYKTSKHTLLLYFVCNIDSRDLLDAGSESFHPEVTDSEMRSIALSERMKEFYCALLCILKVLFSKLCYNAVGTLTMFFLEIRRRVN